jgi:hypothetical protein
MRQGAHGAAARMYVYDFFDHDIEDGFPKIVGQRLAQLQLSVALALLIAFVGATGLTIWSFSERRLARSETAAQQPVTAP